jgi:Skp family chaperone for outer membrane proteins
LVAAVKDGELRGLQDPKSRRYYVPQEDAARLLATKVSELSEKASPRKAADELGELKEGVLACTAFVRHYLQAERYGLFDCLNAATASLEQTQKVLERLVAAVESIATQPKAPHQELMHTINGNPAPWNET